MEKSSFGPSSTPGSKPRKTAASAKAGKTLRSAKSGKVLKSGGKTAKDLKSGGRPRRSTTVNKSGEMLVRGPLRAEGEARVSASTLHRDTRVTLDLLQTSEAVAVTHYNEVEGYLVAPERYWGLVDRVEAADERESELASTMTVLLAAARTGVPVPSELLERVLPNVDVAERWRTIADFAATFPTRITAGEHGEPITRAALSHVGGYVEEFGSDDDLDLD